MKYLLKIVIGIPLCLLAVMGCSQSNTAVTVTPKNPELLLATEPVGAKDVMDIREDAQDGQAVVMLGRVGGGIKPWIEGRAAFLVVDERVLPSCNDEKCDEDCAACAKELASATAMVKFLDAQGKVLLVDARELLGLKEQQTVVIRGVAKREASGSVSIAADGVFIRR